MVPRVEQERHPVSTRDFVWLKILGLDMYPSWGSTRIKCGSCRFRGYSRQLKRPAGAASIESEHGKLHRLPMNGARTPWGSRSVAIVSRLHLQFVPESILNGRTS